MNRPMSLLIYVYLVTGDTYHRKPVLFYKSIFSCAHVQLSNLQNLIFNFYCPQPDFVSVTKILTQFSHRGQTSNNTVPKEAFFQKA